MGSSTVTRSPGASQKSGGHWAPRGSVHMPTVSGRQPRSRGSEDVMRPQARGLGQGAGTPSRGNP
jgi:hypothetical protein